MRILALDTSSDPVSVALAEDGVLIGEVYLHVKQKHSVTLMPALDDLLRLTGEPLQQLQALAVICGPGSFTGVRIGVATAAGLSYGLQIPVYAVSSLDALIAATAEEKAVCAMRDARRGEIYCKAVSADTVLVQENVMPVTTLLDELGGVPELVFTGSGALRYREEILERMPKARFVPNALIRCRAAYALSALERGWAQEKTYDTIRAVYLRPSQAERLRNARS